MVRRRALSERFERRAPGGGPLGIGNHWHTRITQDHDRANVGSRGGAKSIPMLIGAVLDCVALLANVV